MCIHHSLSKSESTTRLPAVWTPQLCVVPWCHIYWCISCHLFALHTHIYIYICMPQRRAHTHIYIFITKIIYICIRTDSKIFLWQQMHAYVLYMFKYKYKQQKCIRSYSARKKSSATTRKSKSWCISCCT
jgi:hypothetical protein